jgi:adenylate cyclase class 2
MLEVETKFKVEDFRAVQRWLAQHTNQAVKEDSQIDSYFNAPDRDFAQTDEALRLRQIGQENVVTYKGPRGPGPGKTRTEIEVALDSGKKAADDFVQLLLALRYRPVATVHKSRKEYRLSRNGLDATICLDQVETLGRFVEIEVMATQDKLGAARDTVEKLAAEMGLEHAEPRTYLELLLARS